jgi:hypothetical protein
MRRVGRALLALGLILVASGARPAAAAPPNYVGLEGISAFSVGRTSEFGDPALGLQLGYMRALWQFLDAGVILGRHSQEFYGALVSEAKVTTDRLALRLQSRIGYETWQTRPFVGADVGLARASASGRNARFSGGESSTTGLYLAPEVGMQTELHERLALRVAARVQYVNTSRALWLSDIRFPDVTGIGVSLGFFYMF